MTQTFRQISDLANALTDEFVAGALPRDQYRPQIVALHAAMSALTPGETRCGCLACREARDAGAPVAKFCAWCGAFGHVALTCPDAPEGVATREGNR